MSNASRCRATAERFARLAESAGDAERRRSYRMLERLWWDMAPLAESFDRRSDERSKERIYAMMAAVEEHRRHVA